jgi:hypothetical protein
MRFTKCICGSPFLPRRAHTPTSRQKERIAVFTHLHFDHDDADMLFRAFAPKSLKEGEAGLVTRGTLDEHFAEFGQASLPKLVATMEQDRANGLFVVKFREYLAHMPEPIVQLGVEVVRAEIVRFHSAPTNARAGYYENPDASFSATVERIFPEQYDSSGNCYQQRKVVPLYAQNIRVVGPTLAKVQELNTKLSAGHLNRFLINAFE